ncbi:GreA/GreB family elongation factor [Deinococcus sonorensis]|uniref:GreA/GreB family elongation factor n=2 Tax=Deinococcus sonorensis TaxID=309891 RepID=A0AAU7UEL7_9DEIO
MTATGPIHMTRAGHERLQQALEQAQQRRDEAAKMLSDLRDDAIDLEDRNLQSAQTDLTGLDARIFELEDALARAVVVDDSNTQDGTVMLGSVVLLHEETQGQDMRVQLVSSVEVTVRDDRITQLTDDSPVGQMVMGRRVGETVTVNLRDREMRYTIQAVQ